MKFEEGELVKLRYKDRFVERVYGKGPYRVNAVSRGEVEVIATDTGYPFTGREFDFIRL